ncbi:MAG: aldo/keto reductase [Steroidobacterales bacterium]
MGQLLSRRELVRLGAVSAAGFGLSRAIGSAQGAATVALTVKAIPASGEKIPVVGLGTNGYSVSDPAELAARRAVIQRMAEVGASVIDTAPAYGESEVVLGGFMAELGVRGRMFVATKITARDGDENPGGAMFENSLKRLRTDRVDLLQVHSLAGIDLLIPVLKDWKAAKRVRYFGATTSRGEQHADLLAAMNRHPLDFIQVNYSLGDRAAADRILPLAAERGIAVLLNLPFGGRRGSLFKQSSGKPLPPYAAELGVASWAQFFLKYAVSHPAVTCAIPGTTQLSHFDDNIGAARGALPDAKQRKQMEAIWDTLPA